MFISRLMCCVCLLVRNVNMNLSPRAAHRAPLRPTTQPGLCPVTRMVTGETKVKRSRGRMPRLSVKHESPKKKPTGAGVFKWEGRARQSARGVRKGCALHRQTVIHRSVRLSVTPTLGSFSLIAGRG